MADDDEPRRLYRAGRHLVGIFFIVCVVVMWVGSSELMTWIYQGADPSASFDKPFFLTYLDCSLFFIYLSGFLFKGEPALRLYARLCCPKLAVVGDEQRPPTVVNGDEQRPPTVVNGDEPDNNTIDDSEATACSVHAWRCLSSTDRRPAGQVVVQFVCCEPEQPSNPHPIDTCSWLSCSRPPPSVEIPLNDSDSDNGADHETDERKQQEEPLWHGYVVAKIGLLIMPFFFLANWLFNASLSMTSVASNTILSSTSGMFTLFMGVLFRVDTFSLAKLVAVLVVFAGVVLVSLSDAGNAASGSDSLMGDLLSLLSACAYASYAILMKKLIPDEQRVSLFMFFGFLGAASLLLMWPLFVLLNYTGVEPFALPTATVWGFLMLNAFVGTVLSDVLWLASLLFTSPLITTLGMTLSIPVAMLFDALIWGQTYNAAYMGGAALVLLGFLLLNLDTPFVSPFFRWLSHRLWSNSCSPARVHSVNECLCPL